MINNEKAIELAKQEMENEFSEELNWAIQSAEVIREDDEKDNETVTIELEVGIMPIDNPEEYGDFTYYAKVWREDGWCEINNKLD